MKVNFKSLLFNTLVPLMLSFIVAMLVPFDKSYYESLNMPIKLDSIVFIVAWSILYLLMGLSAYFIENSDYVGSKKLLKIYYLQLLLNLLFMPIFFYFKNILLATILVVLLMALVIFYTFKVFRASKISGYLLIPYIVWLIFATYLQVGIYFLN